MRTPRPRLRHRYLLALGTFLLPLAVLAVLGQTELQRSGIQAQGALDSGARQFLASAVKEIDQELARYMPPLLEASQRRLAELGPVRTVLELGAQERFAALRDIIVLDERASLIWPTPPPGTLSLPFSRDSRGALQAADLLLRRGLYQDGITLLEHFIEQLVAASPPGRGRRPEMWDSELRARFLLGTAERRLGHADLARPEFEKASSLAGRFRDTEVAAIGLSADLAIAELGTTADRLKLLREIANSEREARVADGLLTAVAQRLAVGIPAEDPDRATAEALLLEEHQRAATRAFAGYYDLVLKYGLRLRRIRQASQSEFVSDADPEERIVSTPSDATTLLSLRAATAAEAQRWHGCAHIGLHVDLNVLLAPILRAFTGTNGTFTLAVSDPDDVPMLPSPAAVPENFVPPSRETYGGLTLRAYPANGERLIAQAEAAARNRTLLMLALFVTALGGALWSWRSVSREAELADLKIDLVSRVSHELKTPLALIRMYGETLGLGRARDPEQASHFGGIITRESERLTALIQRILDFSQQQAGTLQYSPDVVDLGRLLRAVCDAYTPHLEARGAILVETLPDNIFVRCDANACESAIVNLLENAAKYGVDGDDDREIELDLRAETGMATIEVRDRGRGIPRGELDRVFDGFYRASNSGEVRGAGLGLSLVRHFARAHGGEVLARPREDGGSVFRLTLPLAPPADRPLEPTAANGKAHPAPSAPPPDRT
ncbi:MAG TPA: HAMP domain-containing sensor histidine kinase [Planctomycetota bacterium]|nr:HAMP domain-containing sensor histidine kinase [Planctomycetota bacterium]